GTVLKCDEFLLTGGTARVDEDEHAQYVFSRPGDGEQPAGLADRAALAQCPAKHLLATGLWVLGVRLWPVGASPGPEVAVPVLDGDRQAGQLVHCPGDALLALAADRDPGQLVMDGGGAFQRSNRLRQRGVCRGKLLSCGPLLGMEPRIGQRDAGLLGKDPEQKLLRSRRLSRCPDYQVAEGTFETAQRKGPCPRLVLDGQQTTASTQLAELGLDCGAD